MVRPAISHAKDTVLPTPAPQRLLFLQHASVFEHIGGAEYYIDDFINFAHGIYGADNVRTIAPVQGKPLVSRPYHTQLVPRSQHAWIRKLQNRLFFSLVREASQKTIKEYRPTLIINTHVSLGPLAYWLHKRFDIPFATIVYGIDAWGNLWPQDEWCLRNATAILSISEWTKSILTQRGIDGKKIQIIHPRLPAELDQSGIPERPQRDEVRFLTVSRLDAREQYKGQDHVLEALSILKKTKPNLRVKYIIQGDGSDKERLHNLVTALGLNEIVEFRPPVKNRKDLEASYQDADVFIMPSRFGRWNGAWRGEGFGIVYVEAAAYGVPSIAYRCGGAMDIIRHGETGWLVEPDNILELSNSIAACASDLKLVRQLGARAKEWVSGAFTEKPIQKELITALNAVK